MAKTRTMYMHTLDGMPASYGSLYGPQIYFVVGRKRATLVPTLRQIRAEQRAAQEEAARYTGSYEWSRTSRYGYVLVEVPRG